jgi:hypothetical protein
MGESGAFEEHFMKLAKTCAAIVLTLVLFCSSAAHAQAMKLIPGNALIVYKVSDLEATSKKIGDLCGAMGLTAMNPDLADPLGTWCKQKGINAGLNRSGDLAVALLDPTAVGGDMSNSPMIIVPVSDYAAFLGNFPGASTQGDISTVHFNGPDSRPVYMVHWGDYAVASPFQATVAQQPTTSLEIGALAQKELDTKDFVVFANVKALRMMATPQIEKFRLTAAQQIDQQAASGQKLGTMDMSKIAPVAKVAVNQILNLAEEFLNDMDDATVSANIGTDGIGETMIMDFLPDSKLGKLVAQSKMTDESLLSGLPDGKYLVYGGSVSNPEQSTQLLSDFVDPIEQAISGLGPDFSSFSDAIDAFKSLMQSQTGERFGLIAPMGTLGQDPLLQAIAINPGDSKTMLNATHKMTDAYQAAMKQLGLDQQAGTTTVTAAAKTVDGVTFDEFQTVLNMNGQTPQQMQAMQFMMFLYGPNGPTKYVGAVNDQALLTFMGVSDPTVTATIEAIKSNDDPLARNQTLKTVNAQLPTQRLSVIYVPLDQWATTGLNYAKQFASMDMGVKIPEDLPPLGMAFSADGAALRVDAYLPSQLVQNLTQAGLQVFMAMHGPPNPGGQPPQQGGGPGGGL